MLAAATSRGTVLIYRIPHALFADHDDDGDAASSTSPLERIYCVEPSAILVQPKGEEVVEEANESDVDVDVVTIDGATATVEAPVTTRVRHVSAPLGSLVWSCFDGGDQLAAVSDAGMQFMHGYIGYRKAFRLCVHLEA